MHSTTKKYNIAALPIKRSSQRGLVASLTSFSYLSEWFRNIYRKIFKKMVKLQDEFEYAEPDVAAQYKQNYGSFYIGLTQVSIP